MIVYTWRQLLVPVFLRETKKYTGGCRWWWLADSSTCWIKFRDYPKCTSLFEAKGYVFDYGQWSQFKPVFYCISSPCCTKHLFNMCLPDSTSNLSCCIQQKFAHIPGKTMANFSTQCLVAALGLVHSLVVQIACAILRNRQTWMCFICTSVCVNGDKE